MIEGMHFYYDLSLSTLTNSISQWFSLKKKLCILDLGRRLFDPPVCSLVTR